MRSTILFLLLFLFIGCSSNNEDKQYVELSLGELEVGEEGAESLVEISANCKWTAQSDNKNVTLPIQQGEGGTKLSFKVSANSVYDQRSYTITVTSIDNSSIAILKIHQKEKKGFILDGSSDISKEIPAEGGTFTITANTNIDDIEIQKPDWVSITSLNDRSLEKKLFHFTVMENTEGHERTGILKIGKNEMSSNIQIKQVAYLPTSFNVHDFKNVLFSIGRVAYDISVEPSYADISGLSVKSSDESVCVPSFENNKLVLDFKKYGSTEISIFCGDKALFVEDIENFSPDFGFDKEYQGEYSIGYEFNVEMTRPLKYFSFKSSNENVAKITNGNHVLVIGKGEATITARFDLTGKEISFKVTGRNVEASSITLIPKEKQLKVRESFNLGYIISPENTTDKTVKWESDNENVATVDDGEVVAIASGETYITVTTGSGISDKCKVNVQPNKLKWFAGVCNTIPTTSDEVRTLAKSGIYSGPGAYQFTISNYKTFVICIPYGIIKEVSLERYFYNFMDLDSASTPYQISVDNANSSASVEYTMYVFSTVLTSTETDNFTFKTK